MLAALPTTLTCCQSILRALEPKQRQTASPQPALCGLSALLIHAYAIISYIFVYIIIISTIYLCCCCCCGGGGGGGGGCGGCCSWSCQKSVTTEIIVVLMWNTMQQCSVGKDHFSKCFLDSYQRPLPTPPWQV